MILFLALNILMLLVVYYDATRYIIPNWLNVLVFFLYLFHIATAGSSLDIPMAFLGAGIMFAVGFATYALKWMGAGDVKLLAALSLWVGFKLLFEYSIYVALAGGVLSVALLFLRKALFYIIHVSEDKQNLKILRPGAPVPYGIAISVMFMWFLWSGKIAGISIGQQFF